MSFFLKRYHKKLLQYYLEGDFKHYSVTFLALRKFSKEFMQYVRDYIKQQNLDEKTFWFSFITFNSQFSNTKPYTISSVHEMKDSVHSLRFKTYYENVLDLSNKTYENTFFRHLLCSEEDIRASLKATYDEIAYWYHHLGIVGIEKIINLLQGLGFESTELSYVNEALLECYHEEKKKVEKALKNEPGVPVDVSGLHIGFKETKLGYTKEELRAIHNELVALKEKVTKEHYSLSLKEYLTYLKNLEIVEESKAMIDEELHFLFPYIKLDDESKKFFLEKAQFQIAQDSDLMLELGNITSIMQLLDEAKTQEEKQFCEEALVTSYEHLQKELNKSYLYEKKLVRKSE